jgi:hypothetical protein
MIKKRINTDLFIKSIKFVDSLTKNVIDLTNAQDIKFYVRKKDSSAYVEQVYSITDGLVSFQWNSEENTRLGVYDGMISFYKISSASETGRIDYKYDVTDLFQIIPTSEEEANVDDIVTVECIYYGGADGRGIKTIAKTSSVDNVDTYTITYSDSTTSTYDVVNGLSSYELALKHGYVGTETEWLASLKGTDASVTKTNVEAVLTGDITSHNHATQLAEALADYVKKVQGKGLSTNDLTDTLLSKLNGLSNYDDATIKASVTSLQTQLNTLLSGNASTAIESFNEIVAFLANVSDSQTLEGIIAGINTTIASNLKTAKDYADSQISSHNLSTEAHGDIRTLVSNEATARGDADTALSDSISKKVDKVEGKGLSTNDYTTAEKSQLASNKTDIANIQTSLLELQGMTANFMIVGMAKISGDADPSGSKFYGKDENIPLIFNHVRIGLVKSPEGKLYKWCDSLRLTKSVDGKDLSIDGTDGDVMICTDCDMYLYLNNATIDGVEYEIMAVGLVPFSLYGIEAIKLEPHASTPHYATYAKLSGDTRSQAHCIYNTSVIGSYGTPNPFLKTTFRTSGAGVPVCGVSTIASIVGGQNKNTSDTDNYPYSGYYYMYYQLLCAMMYIEGKTYKLNISSSLGVGNTTTEIPSSSTFPDICAGFSGVKIITSDGTEKYYALMSQVIKASSDSTTIFYPLGGFVGTSFYAIEECLEPQRLIDGIKAAGNIANIGASNIYTDMGSTLINDGSVNLVSGEGMEIGKRYYVVRNVDGFKGLSDGICTCVVNCFVKMEFADGAVLKDGTVLTGGKIIYKMSYSLYRGWCLPYSMFMQLQGIGSVCHADASGSITVSYRRTRDYRTLPVITSSATCYGTEATELDMEKGMEEVKTGMSFNEFYHKKRNLSMSFFYPLEGGNSIKTYDCAYTGLNGIWGQGVNGRPANGYKCSQSSAVGCYANYGVASACSLNAHDAASGSYGHFAGGFALHKLEQ